MPSVHVVFKTDNAVHGIVETSDMPADIPACLWVRVRNKAITLSANNLTYARAGERLRWWHAYQSLLTNVPEPYNNPDAYGVVPAWGQAEVLESKVAGLDVGDLLFGLLPTASAAYILELTPGPTDGVWQECSSQRSQMFDFYNTYRKDGPTPPAGIDPEAHLGLRIVAECPWLICSHVFSPSPQTRLHPLGNSSEPWTEEDADLSQAVLISLSAAGKTARAFAWFAQQPRPGNTPLALVQVTRNAANLRPGIAGGPFPVLNTDYGSMLTDDSVFAWVGKFAPARIVICDFGAADNLLAAVYSELPKRLAGVHDIMVLGIGAEAKIYTAADEAATLQTFATVNKRQVNTAGLRQAAIALGNAATYFEQLDGETHALLREEGLGKLAVDRRQDMAGLAGAWDDLCNQKAPATKYINVHF